MKTNTNFTAEKRCRLVVLFDFHRRVWLLLLDEIVVDGRRDEVVLEHLLGREDLAAVAEELFGRFGRSYVEMDPLVLGQVAVTLERLAANVAAEWSLAPEMESKFENLILRVGLSRQAWFQSR